MKIEVTIEVEISLKDASLADAKKIVQQLVSAEDIKAIKTVDIKSIRMI
jgi:hypothetical protein